MISTTSLSGVKNGFCAFILISVKSCQSLVNAINKELQITRCQHTRDHKIILVPVRSLAVYHSSHYAILKKDPFSCTRCLRLLRKLSTKNYKLHDANILGIIRHLRISWIGKRHWSYNRLIKLNFDKHTQSQVNKANQIVGIIRRSFKYLDFKNST
jgi:hypothetical protein